MDTTWMMHRKQPRENFIYTGQRIRHLLDVIFKHPLVETAKGTTYGDTIELTFDKENSPVLRLVSNVSVVPSGLL